MDCGPMRTVIVMLLFFLNAHSSWLIPHTQSSSQVNGQWASLLIKGVHSFIWPSMV